MASLDVSDAFDPEFFDTFTLVRRAEVVDNHGRSVLTPTNTPNLLAVVTAASPNDLLRWPEADISLKSITIVTKVRLQLASAGIKADIVIWGGNTYQVGLVEDYSRFGEGYIFAIAQTTDYTPDVPAPDPTV